MRLRQLEILVAVKECGTITGAAEKLYISQPSLSTAMKEMETELGVLLFQRNINGVIFTAIGEKAYFYSQRILQKVKEIQQIPSDNVIVENPNILLASNFFSGDRLLVETILALQQECQLCKKYRFANNMEKQSWEMIITNLLQSQLDLAVVKIDSYHEIERMQQIEKENLIFEELYEEQLCLVVRNGHPLSKKRITFLDLRNYPCVFDENDLNAYINAIYGNIYCIPDALIVEGQTVIRKYLEYTDAITVMSEHEIKQSDYIHGTQLDILQVEGFQWTRKIGCLHKEKVLNWVEETFISKLFELRSVKNKIEN